LVTRRVSFGPREYLAHASGYHFVGQRRRRSDNAEGESALPRVHEERHVQQQSRLRRQVIATDASPWCCDGANHKVVKRRQALMRLIWAGIAD
jgi:hypothetical protein